jgi:hypothetical protein
LENHLHHAKSERMDALSPLYTFSVTKPDELIKINRMSSFFFIFFFFFFFLLLRFGFVSFM